MSDFDDLREMSERSCRRSHRASVLARLTRILSPRKLFVVGAVSLACGLTSSAFAQTSEFQAVPIAKTPWTSPSGKIAVDLSAKKQSAPKPKTPKLNPIRQTQALAPASQVEQDDLLAAPGFVSAPLEDPSDYAPASSGLQDGDLAPSDFLDQADPLQGSELEDPGLVAAPTARTTTSALGQSAQAAEAPTPEVVPFVEEQQPAETSDAIPSAPAPLKTDDAASVAAPSSIQSPSGAPRRPIEVPRDTL
ncbi:MAG: hypothetical protein HUK22_03260, partial [Thermoguttaceae bacterium]|nr:hypothetical protein [Thermoguttaceae bacterium]